MPERIRKPYPGKYIRQAGDNSAGRLTTYASHVIEKDDQERGRQSRYEENHRPAQKHGTTTTAAATTSVSRVQRELSRRRQGRQARPELTDGILDRSENTSSPHPEDMDTQSIVKHIWRLIPSLQPLGPGRNHPRKSRLKVRAVTVLTTLLFIVLLPILIPQSIRGLVERPPVRVFASPETWSSWIAVVKGQSNVTVGGSSKEAEQAETLVRQVQFNITRQSKLRRDLDKASQSEWWALAMAVEARNASSLRLAAGSLHALASPLRADTADFWRGLQAGHKHCDQLEKSAAAETQRHGKRLKDQRRKKVNDDYEAVYNQVQVSKAAGDFVRQSREMIIMGRDLLQARRGQEEALSSTLLNIVGSKNIDGYERIWGQPYSKLVTAIQRLVVSEPPPWLIEILVDAVTAPGLMSPGEHT